MLCGVQGGVKKNPDSPMCLSGLTISISYKKASVFSFTSEPLCFYFPNFSLT